MLIIRKAALTIDEAGLMLRACPLAKRQGNRLQPNEAAMAILADPGQLATIKKAIKAWNRGEQTLALIALVHLGEPDIKIEAQVRAELAKAGFDPNEPRDDQGRWTSEGGDGGSGREPASPVLSSDNQDNNHRINGLMPGVEFASYRPDYGQANLPSSEMPSSFSTYYTAPSINSLADAQAIVQSSDGQYLGPNSNCASLTRSLTPDLPPASQWQRGELVQGNSDIPVGTAIATFNYHGQPGTNGYGSANNPGGLSGMSHTGIYLGQDNEGITILNQWSGQSPTISRIPWSAWGNNTSEGGSRYYTINP
jgi:hypothetical protein